MAMTERENSARTQLMHYLGKKHHATYAKFLNLFHLHLTDDPEVIGYMSPKEGTITLNPNYDIDQLEVIVRHEILHFYLDHAKRALDKLASLKGIDKSDLNDVTIRELEQDIYGDPEQTSNIAADYEISNLGYTDEDKAIIRSLHALVTEDDHEDWVDLTFEEMYEKLREENIKKANFVYGGLVSPTVFVDMEGNK